MGGEYRVVIAASDGFSDRIERLVAVLPVWAPRTPETMAFAERAPTNRLKPGADTLASGLTLFAQGASPEEDLLWVVEEVELHHGDASHDPPVSVIEVFGATLTDRVREAFEGIGFSRLEPSREGFVAYLEQG
jgi:hypothetical protein